MSVTWNEAPPPPETKLGPMGWLRVILRGTLLGSVTYIGLMLLLLLRLIERPIWGLRRPLTPFITQAVCRMALLILGLRLKTRGRPMKERGAVVANHVSWMDIFTLNAVQRIYFVSKDEVARWPAIGWLARATGTVFIERKGSQAMAQKNLFEARLRAGHQLLFFPEGTSTDGIRVLPFKSTLFAAFFAGGLDEILSIQPVSVIYHAPKGEDPRFYGWWGEMDFGPHLVKMLSAPRHGLVEVVFHDPVKVSEVKDRKALAQHCEAEIRRALEEALPPAARPQAQEPTTARLAR